MKIILALVIVAMLVGSSLIKIAEANPKPNPPPIPDITVTSPYYCNNHATVSLTVEVKVFAIPTIIINGNFYTEEISWLNFSLDNQPSRQLLLQKTGTVTPSAGEENPFNGDPYILFMGIETLVNVADGQHSIAIQGETSLNRPLLKYYHFTTDTSKPKISISAPQNTTYLTSTVSVNFNINETCLWFGYSLDNQENVTLYGNNNSSIPPIESITLSDLSNGLHRLVFHAKDGFGNWGLAETSFVVAKHMNDSSATPTPSPNVPELSWLVNVPLLLSMFFVAVILRHRKNDSNQLSIN